MNKNRRNFLRFLAIGAGGFVFYKIFGSKLFGPSALAAAPNPGHTMSEIESGGSYNASVLTASSRLKIPVGTDLYN